MNLATLLIKRLLLRNITKFNNSYLNPISPTQEKRKIVGRKTELEEIGCGDVNKLIDFQASVM
jgi:hypothetical protein